MPLESKELGLLTGAAIGSFIAGGVIGYFVGLKKPINYLSTTVHKSNDEKFMNLVDNYINKNSLREPKFLQELKEHTFKNVQGAYMLTDPVEAQFFRILLNAINAKKCMEVGTYTGYNTLNCALTIPPDGIVYALDVSEEFVNHGKPFFEKANVAHKIDIRIAPAAETMDAFIKDGQAGTFDFIYVDADKINYDKYFEKGLVLLRSGGFIVLDNALQGGRVVDLSQKMSEGCHESAKAIDALNRKIHVDSRVMISFLRIADGVLVCCKL